MAQQREHLGKLGFRLCVGIGLSHVRVQKRSAMAPFNLVMASGSSLRTVKGELDVKINGAVFRWDTFAL